MTDQKCVQQGIPYNYPGYKIWASRHVILPVPGGFANDHQAIFRGLGETPDIAQQDVWPANFENIGSLKL